ncbi:unnamed protein product [Penicillium olsonii]|uniref:Zn(2)-C6 fungal-type domain-containing protein n=1 Tax=Penicillium olsonii TaxID=99116 RepID=A0A9W4HL32_PENOL|nr:unnamed protein product [Penicillium olsonii]CAG8229124.1 unnamed protein product [Penicillium olsonii]
MYKAAPQRPKKTSIVRSRSGCQACRQRRVKCDEKKPSCRACVRRGDKCEPTTPNFDFRDGVGVAAKPRAIRGVERKTPSKELQGRVTAALDEDHQDSLMDFSTQPTQSKNPLTPESHFMDGEWLSCSPITPQSMTTTFPSPLPSQTMMRSLGRSENEMLYLMHWEQSCAQALPSFQSHILLMAEKHAPLMQALLALSACNMSRSLPEKTEGSIGTSPSQIIYRPRRDCLQASQHYYGSAINQIARIVGKATSSSVSHTLAAMVLFCYFESAMGDFAGFACHAQGVDKFINAHFTAISSNPKDRDMISAWLQAKFHAWWLRMNFSSFSFQASQGSLCLSSDITTMLRSINASRTIIMSILCESYRVSNIALLQLGPCGTQTSVITVGECVESLQTELRKLDEWHSELSQSELPIESFPGFVNRDEGHLRPLRFNSHYFAMNYAYYVCARIMQCTHLLHGLGSTGSRPDHPENQEINYWMMLLIRIVSGLDKGDCFGRNVHSIGISSLLGICLLRCQDAMIGKWIEDWVHEWDTLSVLEEGSFPIYQTRETIRLINEGKAPGNEIYAIALPEEDGGGTGKYMSYNSQCFDEVLTMGRRVSSGLLYCELVPIKVDI